MNTKRSLLFLLGVVYGVVRSQRDAASIDFIFSGLLATVIVVWLCVSQILLQFIDRRNRSKRIQGFSGFLVLLLAIVGIEWLVFQLKVEFRLASDASSSFLSDSAWLVLLPVIAYYASIKKEANQPLEPTPMSVTPRARSSTSRASHERGSS